MKRRSFLSFLVAAPLTRSLPWRGIALALEPIAPAASAAITLSLSDIIAQTIRRRRNELAANVMARNALLRDLKAKGLVKPFVGGLRAELEEKWSELERGRS